MGLDVHRLTELTLSFLPLGEEERSIGNMGGSMLDLPGVFGGGKNNDSGKCLQ